MALPGTNTTRSYAGSFPYAFAYSWRFR